jgi:hypothetical protein
MEKTRHMSSQPPLDGIENETTTTAIPWREPRVPVATTIKKKRDESSQAATATILAATILAATTQKVIQAVIPGQTPWNNPVVITMQHDDIARRSAAVDDCIRDLLVAHDRKNANGVVPEQKITDINLQAITPMGDLLIVRGRNDADTAVLTREVLGFRGEAAEAEAELALRKQNITPSKDKLGAPAGHGKLLVEATTHKKLFLTTKENLHLRLR